jgi:hypothetical protein
MHRALVAGAVLVPAADNLQPDPVACCQSCLANAACTAWVYCPIEGGCTADDSLMRATAEAAANSSSGAASTAAEASAALPAAGDLWALHHGCRLLSLPAFTLRKDSPQIVAKGGAVPFISGAGQPAAAAAVCPAACVSAAALPFVQPAGRPARLPACPTVHATQMLCLLHWPSSPPHPTHCLHMHPLHPPLPCRHPSHDFPAHPARVQRAPWHRHRLWPGLQVRRVAAAAQLPAPGPGGGEWGVGTSWEVQGWLLRVRARPPVHAQCNQKYSSGSCKHA